MKTIFHKNYPFRLWVNSVLWSAVLLTFAAITRFTLSLEEAELIFSFLLIAILFGGAFSWLIFLLCYFIFQRLPHHTLEQIKRIKPIISSTAILAMLVSCLFFGINFSSPAIELFIPLCYTIGILIATVTTKLLEPRGKND